MNHCTATPHYVPVLTEMLTKPLESYGFLAYDVHTGEVLEADENSRVTTRRLSDARMWHFIKKHFKKYDCTKVAYLRHGQMFMETIIENGFWCGRTYWDGKIDHYGVYNAIAERVCNS